MIRKIFIMSVFIFLPCAAVLAQGVIDNEQGNYIISSSDKLITLELEGAQLIDVLKMLSQQTDFNFILSQGMTDRALTLYLNKTPLSEAMNIIFKANNLRYDYYSQSNVFVIQDAGPAAPEIVTKTYVLKYARINNSSIASERSSVLGGAGTSIVEAVTHALSSQGKVIEDSFTNSLIVTDIPTQFPIIEQVLKSIDVPMPQVMIEVEMLDVSKRLVDELGAKLGSQGGDLVNYTPGSRESRFPLSEGFYHGPKGEAEFGTLTLEGMQMALQMFAQDTTTKSLARPKILTVANETAEVNLTIDEVIGIKRTDSSTAGGTQSFETERATTGTRLRVTPQINPETKEITLVLNVFNRESKDSGIGSVNGMSPKNIEERSTKSLIRLKNGETLLIGGLLKQAKEKVVNKVPFAGDIPLIGKFFRYNDKDDQERELLVFLTPRIIDNKEESILEKFAVEREQRDPSKINVMRTDLDKFERRMN